MKRLQNLITQICVSRGINGKSHLPRDCNGMSDVIGGMLTEKSFFFSEG